MGEQWSGAWPHESGQTSPMSSGATPPLPLGAYRNRRFKNRRKDPFFHQIPGCNLAPELEQGLGRQRRKATAM